jgi:tRNA (guanine-N7-)-methyltransferase
MSLPIQRSLTESLIYKPASWFERFKWEDVFGTEKIGPIHVDLGAGDGGFIRARARNHPETHFIGVERLLGRARKISRDALKDQLENLRVVRIEATYAVEWLFPPQSVSSMTVLFPDPWPKRRHHKNRLIQSEFLRLCAKCLSPNGWLGIKTDHEDYFEHIQDCLKESKEFKIWKEMKAEDLLPERTDFETEFIKSNREIHFIAAKPT